MPAHQPSQSRLKSNPLITIPFFNTGFLNNGLILTGTMSFMNRLPVARLDQTLWVGQVFCHLFKENQLLSSSRLVKNFSAFCKDVFNILVYVTFALF